MKVAVIGTGIAGLVSARALASDCDLTVFEAGSYVGGHTNTVDVEWQSERQAIDTGFIVFNEKTYPNFCRLLRSLGVAWQDSEMSFSVRDERSGLEYNGTNWNGLLAQRSNALKPSFWRMLKEIVRFYEQAPELLESSDWDLDLSTYLERGGYSEAFVERHLLPMVAAVWSAPPEGARRFPAAMLVRFFHNHGFLQVNDRPKWLALKGGSRSYVKPLCKPFAERIRLNTPVLGLERRTGDVVVHTSEGSERFEKVVIATHADQALQMLRDADERETSVLGAFRFQTNDTVLHTDTRLMPKQPRAWASWNAWVPDAKANGSGGQAGEERVTVSYWMNRLQSLESETDFIVSLNSGQRIDPKRVLRKIRYSHPQFDAAAAKAQERHSEIDGQHGLHFCGAYWRYGFHEDGVFSGLRVAERMGKELLA